MAAGIEQPPFPSGAFSVSTTCASASACVSSPVVCSASLGVRSSTRNVTSALSCTGPGSGGASATSVPPFTILRGLNGGTASANPVGVMVSVVSRRVNGRAFTTSLSPTLMIVGALKVCLSETMSTGRRSRSPLLGLTPAFLRVSRAASARRIPAPRRNRIGCRDRDRAPRRSGSRRRARPATRRRAIGTTRCAARCGRADRRPIGLAARLQGRGRPPRGRRGSPAAEKRPPVSSKLLFRSLLTPASSRTGCEISYRAWPASASSRSRPHRSDRPCQPLAIWLFSLP